jgi:hypothetical protein
LVEQWSLAEWEHHVRLARRLRLLGRLGESVMAAGLLDRVPAQPRRHLEAEVRFSRWRTGALLWTLERVGVALADAPYPLVLLKGAAYAGQNLPIAMGRLPSDADVLVPKYAIADAQRRLSAVGWKELELDEHDRQYYHEWSHEVPPMRHDLHGLELDLHHNILPPVAHTRVDAQKLLTRLMPSCWPRWQVLGSADQVLHSAAHLFHDSEARDRVRDIVDLDGLLRHFGTDSSFWDHLISRAQEMGLCDPLALACHFAGGWLGTPVPKQAMAEIRRLGPAAWHRAWLVPMMSALLIPTEPDNRPALSQSLAAHGLLMRYHYRRMPLSLLLPHAWHKAQQWLRQVPATSVDLPRR